MSSHYGASHYASSHYESSHYGRALVAVITPGGGLDEAGVVGDVVDGAAGTSMTGLEGWADTCIGNTSNTNRQAQDRT